MSDARRFDVRNELGKGAFGAVYLADLTSASGFSKVVALKVLHAAWSQNPEMAVRLAEEARLLGRLRHPNIVAVDDLVQVEGQWAVVMEYIPGADVEALVHGAREEGRTVPLAVVVGIAESVARALDAAWSSTGRDGKPLQVVHRDIKPSNIRLTPDGTVKVLDFGIAASPGQGSGAGRAGSPAYMAPERLTGMSDGPEGDVYGLGATLYELLVGVMLGRAEGDSEAHAARVAAAHAKMVATRGPLVEPLAALVTSCLACDPAARPTARTLADAARVLSRTTLDGDLVAWARGFVTDGGAATPRSNLTLIGNAGSSQTLLFSDLADEPTVPMVPMEADSWGGGGPAPLRNASPGGVGRSSGDVTDTTTLPVALPGGAVRWWLPATAVAVAAFSTVYLLVGGGVPSPPAPRPVAVPSAVSVPPPEALGPDAGSAPRAVAAHETSGSGEPRNVVTVQPASHLATPRVAAPATPSRSAARTLPAPGQASSLTGATSVPAQALNADAPAAVTSARLRAVKFSVPGATHVAARCGDVAEEGPSSANLRGIPPGLCEVTATLDGVTHHGSVRIDAPRLVLCAVADGGLTCS